MHSPKAAWITDPSNAVLVHFVFACCWLIPGSVVTLVWLANSVAFVAWMSLYAIVIGHWSGLQASLADLRVKEQNEG